MRTKTNKQFYLSTVFVAVLVAIDQITKKLAVLFLKDKQAIPIIKDIFELEYLENTSAAFGMDPISLLHKIFQFDIFNQNPELYLNVRMGFFYLLTIGMIWLLGLLYLRIPNEKRFRYLDLIVLFMIAGAIGNFIDRIMQQYVVDFLYFKLINFPIFNIADIYVTCSAITLLILGLIYYKDEDVERIFPTKGKSKKLDKKE